MFRWKKNSGLTAGNVGMFLAGVTGALLFMRSRLPQSPDPQPAGEDPKSAKEPLNWGNLLGYSGIALGAMTAIALMLHLVQQDVLGSAFSQVSEISNNMLYVYLIGFALGLPVLMVLGCVMFSLSFRVRRFVLLLLRKGGWVKTGTTEFSIELYYIEFFIIFLTLILMSCIFISLGPPRDVLTINDTYSIESMENILILLLGENKSNVIFLALAYFILLSLSCRYFYRVYDLWKNLKKKPWRLIVSAFFVMVFSILGFLFFSGVTVPVFLGNSAPKVTLTLENTGGESTWGYIVGQNSDNLLLIEPGGNPAYGISAYSRSTVKKIEYMGEHAEVRKLLCNRANLEKICEKKYIKLTFFSGTGAKGAKAVNTGWQVDLWGLLGIIYFLEFLALLILPACPFAPKPTEKSKFV